MRCLALTLVFVPALAHAQVWEKLLAPGIVYRMEVDTATPRVLHALRFAREAASIEARPELAQGLVFDREDDRKGREPLSETISREQAVAGINGDFFPWTGDPLGAMVRQGEIVSRPFRGRSAFAWGRGYSTVARLEWSGKVSFYGQEALKLDGLNELCAKDMLVLTTGTGGFAVSEGESLTVVLELEGTLPPEGEVVGKVLTTVEGDNRVPVGKKQAALTATGASIEKLRKLSRGESVTLTSSTKGVDWGKAQNVIGGGPVIVSGGKPIQAWDAEDFNNDFAGKRHPRSAVGHTKSGDIWLVVIEGRQSLSSGATISELAEVMARLGCQDALNLDGGGSSELAIRDLVVSRPSDGLERPIANSILVFGPHAVTDGVDFVIKGKPSVTVGGATDYSVVDESGSIVPNSAVVWAASGDAWVDQSGRLRALQPGKAQLKAWVDGKVVGLEVTVLPPNGSNGRKPGNPKH